MGGTSPAGEHGVTLTQRTPARERLAYLDWLRVVALVGVFLYHCLQPFSTDDWHVKNAELSEAITIPISFFGTWGIGFFFLISGAGTCLALRWRSTGQYVAERLTRLLIPLVVAYILLAPFQAYIEASHFGRFEGSFLEFVPRFFDEVADQILGIGVGSDPLLVGFMFHLWFVVFLLWYSLLGIPIFHWLRGPRGRRLIAWLGDRAHRTGFTLLAAVPIVLVTAPVYAAFPDEHDWGEFAYYAGFFVAGFVLMSDTRLMAAVRRDLVPALAVGIAGFLALIVGDVEGFIDRWERSTPYSWEYVAFFGTIAVQAWAWAQAATSIGMRVPAFARPLPRIVSEAAMPFFIVHQPVIVGVAFVVVRWDAGIGTKLLAVLVVSFVISAALAWALARIPVVSLGLGVKRRDPAPQ
jgi:peptidoglycan/LPS O-acetylase OafA/YrhL